MNIQHASNPYDVIVVGAGQAGLAAGYHLQKLGFSFLIVEAKAEVGGSWAEYYDSLKLFSPVEYSSLPGLSMSGKPEHYPHRDEVVTYLKRYAEHFRFPIQLRAKITSVSKSAFGFCLLTQGKETLQARALISATGSFGKPFCPQILGQETFKGEVLHTSSYRSPDPFTGKRVVVVGAGNSAVQLGVELAQVAKVTLAVRRAPKFVPQAIFGRDIHFWSRLFFIDGLPLGRWMTFKPKQPVLDDGTYQQAIKEGTVGVRPMFERFIPQGVQWSNGFTEAVDTIIFATGYLPHLDYLKPALLGGSGTFDYRAGLSGQVDGLFFVGLEGQQALRSATLRGVGPDAEYVVKKVRRYLQKEKPHKK